MCHHAVTLQAQYNYDPYGRRIAVSEMVPSDFQFTCLYFHFRSGLNLAPFRAYSPPLGRWLNQDPLYENGGINLYVYCLNNSIVYLDPSGRGPIAAAWAGAGAFIGGAAGGIAGAAGGTLVVPGVGTVGGAAELGAAGAVVGASWGSAIGSAIENTLGGNGGYGSGARHTAQTYCQAKKPKPREGGGPIVAITPKGTPISQHGDDRMKERDVGPDLVDEAIDKGPISDNPNFQGGKRYVVETNAGVKIYVNTDGRGAVVTVTEGP